MSATSPYRLTTIATAMAVALGLAGCATAKSAQTNQPEQPETFMNPPLFPTPPLPQAAPAEGRFGGKTLTLPIDNSSLVAIRIAFQAGSIDDPVGKEGLTALTAGLMAEGGTAKLSSAQLLEALFPMAASIDWQLGKELTVFHGAVHRDHLSTFVPLLVDSIASPRWDPKEFERLRTDAIMAIEKRLRAADDEGLGKEALNALIWAGHPYGHYEGGTVQALRAITLGDCKAQAARLFVRERMVIGVAGAATQEGAKLLEAGLAKLPTTGAPIVALPAPSYKGARALLVEKEAQSTAISMGYPYALRRGAPDYYAMMVAGSALGEHRQFTGRLMRELRTKRGLNYGDYAYIEHFEQEGWSTLPRPNVAQRQQDFTVWLRPVAQQNELFAIRAARQQVLAYREGISQQEFELIRGFLHGYTLLWEQTPMRRLGYAIDDLFYGTTDFLGGFRKALETMTVEEVNRAINVWIDAGELSLVAVTRDAKALREAILSSAPSPITYVAAAPEPEVLKADEEIVDFPLGITAEELEVTKAEALFER